MQTPTFLKSKTLQTVACSLCALSMSHSANASNIGLNVKAGTLGLGVEIDYQINDTFNVRLQSNGYTYDDDFEEDDIDYRGEIELSSTGILLDYRPFQGVFRLTGGVYSNSNELTGNTNSVGNETYDIGDNNYRSSANDPLNLNLNVALGNSTAGYLGIGWGSSPSKGGWMFSFELGVLFSGEPTVDLEANGSVIVTNNGISQTYNVNDSSNPYVQEFQAELRNEEKNLEDDISDFTVYPVISLGIGYRF